MLAFAGIGDPARGFDTLRTSGIEAVRCRAFADHHALLTSARSTDLIAAARHEALTLVTTEKDLARFWTNGAAPSWAEAIVPFAVTLAFDDPARLRKFVSDRLFRAREKKFRE